MKVEHWLHRLAIPRKTRSIRQRLATAIAFLEKIYPADGLLGHLRSIDFTKSVQVVKIHPPVRIPEVGQTTDASAFQRHVLVQFYHPKHGHSNNLFTWLQGEIRLTRLASVQGRRTMRFYVVQRPVQALESYASAINDSWTVPAKMDVLLAQAGRDSGSTTTRSVDKGTFVTSEGLQLMIPLSRLAGDALVELVMAQ